MLIESLGQNNLTKAHDPSLVISSPVPVSIQNYNGSLAIAKYLRQSSAIVLHLSTNYSASKTESLCCTIQATGHACHLTVSPPL